MIEIVILMAVIGFVNYVFTLTLLDKRIHRITYALVVPIILFLAHFWSIGYNYSHIVESLKSHNLLSGLSAIEIAQLIVTSVLVLGFIQKRFGKQNKRLLRMAIMFPSIYMITGALIIQNWLFNHFTGERFMYSTASLAAGIFTAGFLLTVTLRFLIRSWKSRLELKMLIAILQIVSAMMLPVLLLNINLNMEGLAKQDLQEVIITISILALGVLLGYVNYKLQILNILWKSLTKSFSSSHQVS